MRDIIKGQPTNRAFHTLLWWFGFRPEPIFDNAPAASENDANFKSGQK